MMVSKIDKGIQSLRALAVLLVFGYHLGVLKSTEYFFSYGFLGVDIFIVISGFLIANIFKNDLISLKKILNFYIKRIKRLLPAIVPVVIFSQIYGFINFLPSDLYISSLTDIFSLAFILNIYLHYNEFNYFATNSNYLILKHFWSLGLEMQFYLIAPFIFLIKRRFFIIILMIISIIFSFFYESNFFLIHFRIWEFLLGSYLCFFRESLKFKFINYFPILGVLIILLGKDNDGLVGLSNLGLVFIVIFLLKYRNKINFANFP